MNIIEVGTKIIEVPNNKAVVLYDILTRKNKSKLYKSVFIHRDGSICVEEFDGNFRKNCDRDGFDNVDARITRQIANVIPMLIEQRYFHDDIPDDLDRSFHIDYYSLP